MNRPPSSATTARTAIALAALALLGTSCDVVANLSFQPRTFSAARVAGVMAVGDSEATCSGSNGSGVMRFALFDQERLPISPESTVNNTQVMLTSDDVTFDNSNSEILSLVRDPACTESSSSCAACNSTYDSASNSCLEMATSIDQTAPPQFVSALDRPQALAILIEDTASVAGNLPGVISTYFPDYLDSSFQPNPDGTSEAIDINQGVPQHRALPRHR